MTQKIREEQLATWLGDVEEDSQLENIVSTLDEIYSVGPSKSAINQAIQKLSQTLESEAGDPIYYTRIEDTPFGDIWVAASESGLIAVEYDLDEAEFINLIHKLNGGRPEKSKQHTSQMAAQIEKYLEGKTDELEMPVDLSALTDFRRQVLEATAQVARGQVVTYADIAKQIGKPNAFRAVGQALRYNPVPIVIPCHRVIASDGTLGGYAGHMGDARKIRLLKLEGVMLA